MFSRKVFLVSLAIILVSQSSLGAQTTAVIYDGSTADRRSLVSVEFENKPLADALHVLARKVKVGISYDTKTMPKKLITHRSEETSIYKVLDAILSGTGLVATLSENRKVILIKKKLKLLNVQQETITGTVTDAQSGQTLPGVNILVKGTSTGTSTDSNGQYELTIESLQDTLVISYIGYQTQNIPVNGRTTVNIEMQSQALVGGELVVTALGIEREERSLTYSNQELEGDQINEAKEINVVNSLQGKVAGVQITKNATGPGSESNVTIRGSRSITNSNQPLYVVDGVPTNGSIEMLNSDNVENISVLKGASAAALYGSQGQNGAIIITTKTGESGDISVNYNGGFTFKNPLVMPELQYKYGQGDAGTYNSSSENGWGPLAEGQEVTLWNDSTVPLEGQEGRLEEFFRTGATYNNTISVQGGSEKMQTFFSYGNTSANGILPNNDLTKHNLNLKINNNVSSKFSVLTKLNYTFQDVNNRVPPGDAGNYVLPSIYRAPTSIPLSEMKKYSYTDDSGLERQSYWNPGSSVNLNPYWGMNRILFNEERDRIAGLFNAEYEFTDWLSFQVRGSYDKTIQNEEEKVYADNYWSQVGSNYELDEFKSQSIYADALLSYDRALGQEFNLSGNFGTSLQQSKYESVASSAGGLYKRNFFFMNNARDSFVESSYGKNPQVLSLYGTATLGYNEYLYLDITARNDWSSALPEENQSYFYPSFGLSAIVSDMLELPPWISYGKVRLSYASAGYGGTEYLDQSYYSVASGGAIITPSIQSLGNYKPEITTSFEVGMDWQLFDDAFGFNATYYNSETKNQLLLIGIPPATLFSEKYINAGLIQNSGVEFTGNFTPVSTQDFTWQASLNFSKNVNTVKRLTDQRESVVINEGDNVYLVVVEEGGSYGDLYVKGWKEDEQGRKLVTDNGTPILTDGLTENVGNVNPDWLMGLSSSFSYKNLDLSFLIDHRQGGTVMSGTQALIDAYGVSKASLRGRENGIVLDAYTQDGTKNASNISAQKYFSLIGGRYPSAGFYNYSGTNTRLRELIISYSFSQSLLSKIGVLKNAQVSLVGRNLFFFHRSAPIDPEVTRGVNGRGLEYAALPPTRNIGFNFKLSF